VKKLQKNNFKDLSLISKIQRFIHQKRKQERFRQETAKDQMAT